jgi:3-deoxy-D-manno-octulosonic-acid transferase
MKTIWYYLYNIIIFPVMYVMARVASLFKEKIRMGIRDRKGLLEYLAESMLEHADKHPRIWFHASSLGEFEQAKPIIRTLRDTYPDGIIIVTFFSPSGYRHSINYKYADSISYMPFDTRTSAKRFIEIVRPDVAVFIRYDIWPNHIWALSEAGIPFFLSSATMREKSVRFKPGLLAFHRRLFNLFTAILTVTDHDAKQFRRYELSGPVIEPVGDTRYDQVIQRSGQAEDIKLLPEGFTKRKKVFVIGSSWQGDEDNLLPVIARLSKEDRNMLTILVPHEPTEANIDRIEKQLNGLISHIRFSHMRNYNGERMLIVDSVGILLPLYKYAHVAYIGGGFKNGVHNVLEAAVYGIPVLFGPRHTNSQEAMELARRGGGFVVSDSESMHAILHRLFSDSRYRKQAGAVCKKMVQEHAGATEQILRHLKKHLHR